MALFRVTAVVLALTLSASAGSVDSHGLKNTKPSAAPIVTPDQRFQIQLDAANVALDKFLRSDCSGPDTMVAAGDLLLKMKNLRAAYQDLPDDEDQLIQLRHSEAFVGFTEVSTYYTDMKHQACTQKPAPKAAPGGNNG